MALSEKYRYGDAGDRYPVEPGDVWSVGRHTLACGDIEQRQHRLVLGMADSIEMAYMDPPWDPANITLFRRKAGFDKGKAFEAFLVDLVEPLNVVRGSIFIEMGSKYLSALVSAVEAAGATVYDEWPIVYYGRKPCHLIRAGFTASEPMTASPRGMDDADTPEWAVQHATASDGTVVDICCGQGTTAVAAATHGRTFLGMELNPRRLAVTIDKLVKMGEGEAKRVGRI